MRKSFRLVWLLPILLVVSALYSFGTHWEESQGTKSGNTGRRLLQEDAGLVRNCVPPSINDFPDDFMSQEQRARGGVLIHIGITAYACLMLAIVCDQYFVPSLEIISNYTKVSSDVAGATFMAIGTSAPELFTSIIGSFMTEGDIGVGTIVGSAVFNILAVTGVCGIALGKKAIDLDWFPITRDSLTYVLTISSLIAIIYGNLVTWWEAACLIILFFLYLLVLWLNPRIESAAASKVKLIKLWWGAEKAPNEKTPLLTERIICSHGRSWSDPLSYKPKEPFRTSSVYVQIVTGESPSSADVTDSDDSALGVEKGDSLCSIPSGGFIRVLSWCLLWPANLLFTFTIPDCKRSEKFFVVTFLMSVIWLGLLSYVCFWMVSIIGFTMGIPDTVAGITILAAGTSVPELISSVLVVRQGLGNMALSNLVGSNVFDILFCLGVPWLVKALVSGSFVINSSALTYTTITLLSTMILLYLTLLLAKWKLDWKVGVVCLLLYAIFLVLSSLSESNVLGNFNPPQCPT